ncbi:hypothetical protein OTB20_17105 [Streptomyces sp. H27-H1]|uniref:hypothetical protein n=1 Tax=Streptomyces sp. H27-H1 TaxID=2996461 RepID=UPI00226DB139|nr:hypothetical protein [Streptomyces sp. H27-H1]MCY0927901.1 hypothetical protein [Streptomyces sp. H27-H1]
MAIPELPIYDRKRAYYTLELAEACAKGGYGHKYWMPRSVLKGVLAYREGARSAAVRRAQVAGRYERVPGLRVVLATHGTDAVTLEGTRGGAKRMAWNDVGPRTRLRLFHRTPQGLEPVALWLNEDRPAARRAGLGAHFRRREREDQAAGAGALQLHRPYAPSLARIEVVLGWQAGAGRPVRAHDRVRAG